MRHHLLVLACVLHLWKSYALFVDTEWSLMQDRPAIIAAGTAEERRDRLLERFRQIDRILVKGEPASSVTLNMSLVAHIISTENSTSSNFRHLEESLLKTEEYYEDIQRFLNGKILNYPIKENLHLVQNHTEKMYMYTIATFQFFGNFNSESIHKQVVRRMGQSLNQVLYQLYSRIALTKIKGYVLIQLLYLLLEIRTEHSYCMELKSLNEDFFDNSDRGIAKVKNALAKSSNHFWRYDPGEKRKNGLNYLEITGLGQGYIINEKALVEEKSCTGECNSHKIPSPKFPTARYDPFHAIQSKHCSGDLYNCKTLSDTELRVCQSDRNSNRRYEYIQYATKGKIKGRPASCSSTDKITTSKSCSHCLCHCDQRGRLRSNRTFSLRESVSNIENNKAVTGLRFGMTNQIIYVQVQQGKLLPHGRIDANTLEWVPVHIGQRDHLAKRDMFEMNWYNKILDLHVLPDDADTTYVPEEAVLTGVRFRKLESSEIEGRDTRLYLEIQMTRFNFAQGKLYPERASMWVDGLERYKEDRTEINVDDLDVPTRAKLENTIHEGKYQYVKFTPTSIDWDVAQTMVPFLDAQDVVPSSPMALRGAGLYYKSTPGYGGFVGLKVLTYDPSIHF